MSCRPILSVLSKIKLEWTRPYWPWLWMNKVNKAWLFMNAKLRIRNVNEQCPNGLAWKWTRPESIQWKWTGPFMHHSISNNHPIRFNRQQKLILERKRNVISFVSINDINNRRVRSESKHMDRTQAIRWLQEIFGEYSPNFSILILLSLCPHKIFGFKLRPYLRSFYSFFVWYITVREIVMHCVRKM